MYELTEGALDQIMNGIEVEQPILQILGHKQVGSANMQERYRLLISDGVRTYSFAMLATQLNSLITEDKLTEFSVCQINRYAIGIINNTGREKRVMVILDLDVKIPGTVIGKKICNPTLQNESQQIGDAASTGSPAASPDTLVAAPAPAPEPVPGPSNSTNSGRHVQPQDPQLNKPRSADCCIMAGPTPIADLSPYNYSQNIRARVTNKSAIIPWNNSRGEGIRFSMDLIDETSEIKCTAFRDECERFHRVAESGKVYHISKFCAKLANKQFNHLKNEYEIIMRQDTTISPCFGDSTEIPTVRYNFIPMSEIDTKETNVIVDVLGICKSCRDTTKIVTKATRKELSKRDVNLVDESNTMVTLTLWGGQAEQFNGSSNPVVAVKGARITEFNGRKSLNTPTSSIFQIDPDIPEALRLRGWYNTTGCSGNVRVISNALGLGSGGLNEPWLTFKEAKDMQLGCKEGPDFFVVKATINMIRTENALYKACLADGCKKKLVEISNEIYRCEKCNREYPDFKYQLLGNINLADWTDNQWVTAFDEKVEQLIGLAAQELAELKASNDDEFYEKLGESAYKTFVFKLRVKMENFRNENRLKTTVVAVSPLDFKDYNSHLISQIKEFSNVGEA